MHVAEATYHTWNYTGVILASGAGERKGKLEERVVSDHPVAAVLPAAPGFWEPSPGCDDHHAAFPKERRVEVSDGTPLSLIHI